MANLSQIKLPNGTTYNIKDSISGYTTNTGTITQVKTTAGAHTTINVSSGAATFNVPTKTSHLTNDSGFITTVANDSHSHSPSTIYIPTNYTRTGSLDLFSATRISSYMSNKSFAIPPEAVSIEYSIDGGNTWLDYGATESHKRGLFAETRNGCNTYLGKASTKEANSLNNQLRITISRINLGRYTAINSFYTWMSTNGNTVYCKLERSLNSSPTVFETVFDEFQLNGWSGHNIRYFSGTNLGGGNDNQPYAFRLTVWQTAITTNYPSANLYDIRFYGPDTYSASAPYYKVQTNELYTWDNYLNAIFPAQITATKFNGTATNAEIANVAIKTGDSAGTFYLYPQANNEINFGGSASKATVYFGYRTIDNQAAPTKYVFSGSTGTASLQCNKVYLGSGTTAYIDSTSYTGTAANVTGTVAIANGGTGQTTAANAINALLNGLPTWTADPTDSTYFIRQDTGGSATYGKVKASTIWNYISGKLPSWSQASTKPSYTFSEIGSKPTTISGYGITDAYTKTEVDNKVSAVLRYKGVKAAVSNLPTSGNVTGDVWHVTATSGEYAWDGTEWQELGTAISIPANTGSSTTGISIAAHGTGTVTGVQSTTTTASKVTVGSSSTDYGVKSAGSASTWTFEEKTIPNVTAAGSASTWTFEEKTIPNVTSAGTASSWTFEEKTIPNVTAAGSGSASLTFAMDTTDTKKLKITFSHTHTAPTIGTAIKVQSKSGGSNGMAPTLGTAIKVQSKSGGANGTAPTLGTAIKVQSKSGGANSTAPTLGSKVPTVSASDVTVPIKNTSASTFVTGTTHTVTDNGHTHTI